MITIAIHHMGGQQWTAGLVVQEMLLRALRALPRPQPRIFLTTWKETPACDQETFLSLVDGVICLPSADGNARAEALRQNGVDVFFSLPIESALTLGVPRVVWVYDFQHHHYPANFPPEELARRYRLFKAHADSADRILIYSHAVMNDLATFMPQAVERARLIRFVPHIPSDIGEVGSIDVGRRYGLPEQFFLLPNHFLPHKNHAVVLEALGLLAARGCRPVVVCTGQDRTPTAEQVTFRSRELGIESQFIRLGVVPRNEYFYLLRASIAVLNPSQFEGFGLSVPEAGYLGIPLILSDIPALREHAFEKTSYFDPAAPRQLADIMAAHLAQHATRTAAIPLRAWPNEQARFGRELLTIFEEAHHV